MSIEREMTLGHPCTTGQSEKVSQLRDVCCFATNFDFLLVDGYPPCITNKTDIGVNGVNLSITRTRTVCGWFANDFDLELDGEGIQFRFVQLDHPGGYCDCWSIACDVLLINSSGNIVNSM